MNRVDFLAFHCVSQVGIGIRRSLALSRQSPSLLSRRRKATLSRSSANRRRPFHNIDFVAGFTNCEIQKNHKSINNCPPNKILEDSRALFPTEDENHDTKLLSVARSVDKLWGKWQGFSSGPNCYYSIWVTNTFIFSWLNNACCCPRKWPDPERLSHD